MISVIIPVYKQTELFLRNLKANLAYLKGCEVIIVNDYPQESLKTTLRDLPIILIENKNNLGFGRAVNVGVKKASNRFVILLNSDVVLKDKSFISAQKHFRSENKLFAVSFAQQEKDGSIVGKNKIFWAGGFIQHSAVKNKMQGINAWAEGGACMIDKQKFTYLGGFDEIYSPFYWEDIDLSYRAWKSGYEILFDPKILVKHWHESTIGAYFTSKQIKAIAYRNQIIFVWKNITDRRLFWKSLILIKLHVLLELLKGNAFLFKSYFAALLRLPDIIRTRRKQKKLSVISDRDIINKFDE